MMVAERAFDKEPGADLALHIRISHSIAPIWRSDLVAAPNAEMGTYISQAQYEGRYNREKEKGEKIQFFVTTTPPSGVDREYETLTPRLSVWRPAFASPHCRRDDRAAPKTRGCEPRSEKSLTRSVIHSA